MGTERKRATSSLSIPHSRSLLTLFRQILSLTFARSFHAVFGLGCLPLLHGLYSAFTRPFSLSEQDFVPSLFLFSWSSYMSKESRRGTDSVLPMRVLLLRSPPPPCLSKVIARKKVRGRTVDHSESLSLSLSRFLSLSLSSSQSGSLNSLKVNCPLFFYFSSSASAPPTSYTLYALRPLGPPSLTRSLFLVFHRCVHCWENHTVAEKERIISAPFNVVCT